MLSDYFKVENSENGEDAVVSYYNSGNASESDAEVTFTITQQWYVDLILDKLQENITIGLP